MTMATRETETEERPKVIVRPWVEWRARRIDDPILRLRYLRQTAPECRPERRRLKAAARALTVCLAVAATSFFVLWAAVKVEPLPARARRVTAPLLGFEGLPDVWQVEKSVQSETYSNGLRIDNRHLILTHPRSFHAWRLDRPDEADPRERTEPVGIVYHTTESMQAPFEPGQNRMLQLVGESTLDYVRRHQAYNFLIDRFGRVYRIVRETDAAEHAGHSVWSDEQWLYIHLNESFVGVSFEAKTQPGQEDPAVSPAQIRAAAMLTEMLRSRYAIRAGNCVTHAQVSVNPSNMRVGWHTDWASSFPFEKMGLPDNYARPIAALAVFGFEADSTYLRVGGARLYAGVEMAEEKLRERAAERGVPLEVYRRGLQRRYREIIGRSQRAGTAAVEAE
jgi:hypothetical protein